MRFSTKGLKRVFYSRAVELASLIQSRRLSPVELMQSVLGRIAALDRELNAFCTVSADSALEAAKVAERMVMQRKKVGPLHGLPIAIKDLIPTAGIRTTFGSKIFADCVPTEDAVVVARLKAAGAIVVGKTNMPEFAAGGHTFNLVCGTTRNPWALDRSSGGSSGGSAVALAAGMVPLAEGSDLGGSLRIPASFCGVVGFRTSPGLVPFYPTKLAWDSLAVEGPMARTVEDAALMLGAIVGPDERVPISYRAESEDYLTAARSPSVKGLRVAWSPNLGLCPVDPEIRAVAEGAVRRLERLGARIEEAHPNLSGVEEVIRATRGVRMVALLSPNLEKWRSTLNPELIGDIEDGLRLSVQDIAKAETLRTELWERARSFMSQYDILITPTVPIKPFPADLPFPKEINGEPMESYLSWLVLTYAISMLGLPAISVPAGFTADGLPVGVQLVGRWRDEINLLRAAAAFESDGAWIAPPRYAETTQGANRMPRPVHRATKLERTRREALTARDIEELHRAGDRQVTLRADAFLTPLARDRARALGIEIVAAADSRAGDHARLKPGAVCCGTGDSTTSRRGQHVAASRRASAGVTLLAASNGNDRVVRLVDMDGAVVHSWGLPSALAGAAYLDGRFLICNARRPEVTRSIAGWEQKEGPGAGALLKLDWNGRLVAETRFPEHHHDGKELPDGNVLLLCVERAPTKGSAIEWWDWLAEFSPDGTLVWEWHAREHLRPSSERPAGSSSSWTGATSLAVLPSGDIAIAFPSMTEVLVVERATGRVAHRLTKPVVAVPQHVSPGTNGTLLVVQGGGGRDGDDSQVLEIEPSSGTVRWKFQSQRRLSSAQRLPNGNTLITEPGRRVFEVSGSGEVVWEFAGPAIADVSSSDRGVRLEALRYELSQIGSVASGPGRAPGQQAVNQGGNASC